MDTWYELRNNETPERARQSMTARASRISLIVFVVLIMGSVSLASVPGAFWPWYAVTSIFAIMPLVVGPRVYRVLGLIALLLSGALIVNDIAAGARFRAKQ